jgi:asparagine synthetase B (glutamine-hydrolysing)
MCGVVGAVNWGDRSVLVRMTDIQSHRGSGDSGIRDLELPDGCKVGLGSRRITILDLSPVGYMLMGNGERIAWLT